MALIALSLHELQNIKSHLREYVLIHSLESLNIRRDVLCLIAWPTLSSQSVDRYREKKIQISVVSRLKYLDVPK